MQRSGKTQSSLKCLSESFVYFFFNQILKYLQTVSVKTKQVGTGNSSELNTLFAGGSGSFITSVLSARKSQSRVPSHGCFIVTANWNSEKLWLASSFFFFFSGGGLTPTVCQAPGPSDTLRGRLGDTSVSGRLASNGLVPPRSVSG